MRALVVAGAVAGCAEESEPGAGRVLELRPGDTLLDHTDRARLLAHPRTSLPEPLAARVGESVRLRTPAVHAAAWQVVAAPPPEWAAILAPRPGLSLWMAKCPVPADPARPLPVAYAAGRRLDGWDPTSSEPFPGLVAWWDEALCVLLALSPSAPERVSVEVEVASADEFGHWERGSLLRGLDGPARPVPGELLGRFTQAGVTRTGLLLAAPGVLEWSLDALHAERLELEVALADQGWRGVAEGLQRARRQGDGVRVAVEVVARHGSTGGGAGAAASDAPGVSAPPAAPGAQGAAVPPGVSTPPGGAPAGDQGDSERAAPAVTTRVWDAALPADAAGGAALAAAIDLSPWRGQPIALRLVSEPGAAGDSSFDYVVWSGLRLRGGAEHAPARPHVVVVVADTLRADRLGAVRGSASLTPRLDAWAASRAVVHTDARATGSWTLPSTASMLTGLAVHQHGIDRSREGLDDEAETLARRLREAGYETAAWVGGGYLRPAFGFDQGFDRYAVRDPKDIDWSEALQLVRRRDGERPLFVLLHTYLVHAPYPFDPRFADPAYDGPLGGRGVDSESVLDAVTHGEMVLDERDRAYVEALYDALVARLDESLGALLVALEAELASEGLLVVVTADHGEAFLEHGLVGHGQALYEELLAVPLLVRFPDGQPAVRDDPVSLLDLVPTVLDVAGVLVPPGLPGRSLRASAPDEVVRVAQHDIELRSVTSGGLKLIEHREPGAEAPLSVELYDLVRDAAERKDLSAERAAEVAELQRRMAWFFGAHPPPEGSAPELRELGGAEAEELRALGYLGDER